MKIKDQDYKFEIFNIGSGISYSFDDIIEIIERKISKKLNLEYENDEESFIQDIKADISKVKKLFLLLMMMRN